MTVSPVDACAAVPCHVPSPLGTRSVVCHIPGVAWSVDSTTTRSMPKSSFAVTWNVAGVPGALTASVRVIVGGVTSVFVAGS